MDGDVMAFTKINGINTYYEVVGSGPPLLMMAAGGFDATVEKWRSAGIWTEVRPLETFTDKYTCIVYDRRESSLSGGKVERVTWTSYAQEAIGLLRHLDIERAFILGGCMGCSPAVAFAVAYPEATLGLVLHHPVGGVRWWLNASGRFQSHIGYVRERGLASVVELAREKKAFWKEPLAGPWASTIAADPDFAKTA